ncbi:MAG: glycosyltransferase [Bdellovibrionales bacterium]|nr:glycosyltransferase [Bdellovibrionales bacterium]
MPSLKLLTIMIPVYNGGKFIDSLLKQFENYISDLSKSDDFFARVEIIVFNNVSTDRTREVVEMYLGRIPNLNLVNHKDHVKTAEENVFRSYAYCKGTYTWVLGVDDFPVFDNFTKTLNLLESNRYDFLIFNLGTVNQNHRLVKTNIFSLENQTLEGNLADLSQLVGLWFVVAAMSNQILRTSLIRGYDLDALVKRTSAIYSHVVAYLEAFAGKTSALVGFPLVFYKVTYRDTAHWNRTAESLGVYNEYFWTEGLVRQIEYLEEKGLVPKSFFFNLLDRNEYFVFRPVFVVIHKVISQLSLMCERKCAPRNVISSESLQGYCVLLNLEIPI